MGHLSRRNLDTGFLGKVLCHIVLGEMSGGLALILRVSVHFDEVEVT